MGDFWSEDELAAMDLVSFEVNDRGQTVRFRTPVDAEVEVKGNPRPIEWQVQQGLGLDGATAKLRGIGLASGTITIRMGGSNGSNMRQEYDLCCRKYLKGPARNQPAPIFTVKNPRFTRYSPPVLKIHLKDDPCGDWDKAAQIETIVFNWEEDRKPSPTLSSPSTAGASKTGAKASDKTTEAALKTIAENNAKIKDLSQALNAIGAKTPAPATP